MSRFLVFLAAATVTSGVFAQEQSADLARAAMHFSAKAMDADSDGMISKDEFMTYHATVWDQATQSSRGVMTVSAAAAAFARGGMHVDVSQMDPDKDGTISKDEFMAYEATHWGLMSKDASGRIAVGDMVNAMKKHREQAAAAEAAKSD